MLKVQARDSNLPCPLPSALEEIRGCCHSLRAHKSGGEHESPVATSPPQRPLVLATFWPALSRCVLLRVGWWGCRVHGAPSPLTCLNSSQELVQVQKWALYWPRVTAISVLPR